MAIQFVPQSKFVNEDKQILVLLEQKDDQLTFRNETTKQIIKISLAEAREKLHQNYWIYGADPSSSTWTDKTPKPK